MAKQPEMHFFGGHVFHRQLLEIWVKEEGTAEGEEVYQDKEATKGDVHWVLLLLLCAPFHCVALPAESDPGELRKW